MKLFKKIMVIIFILVIVLFNCKKKTTIEGGKITNNGKPFKILHVMSYHAPYEWTDELLRGFQEALADVDAEYNVFQMQTDLKSDEESKLAAGKAARELFESYKPDLVYTTDDNAQKYFAKYYINNSVPFVFAAVNSNAKDYGYVGSTNIAGVQEQEHILPSINFITKIKPSIKKITVITDSDATWPRVIDRIKAISKDLKDITITIVDPISKFADFKKKMIELQKTTDAICYLGVFRFQDEKGNNVPLIDVQKWIVENSKVPDFSFWGDRVMKGVFCSVIVSGYEQGLAAGKIARGILIDKKKTSDYPFEPTVKGVPMINLARAKKIGVTIESEILLTANVIEKYEWDK